MIVKNQTRYVISHYIFFGRGLIELLSETPSTFYTHSKKQILIKKEKNYNKFIEKKNRFHGKTFFHSLAQNDIFSGENEIDICKIISFLNKPYLCKFPKSNISTDNLYLSKILSFKNNLEKKYIMLHQKYFLIEKMHFKFSKNIFFNINPTILIKTFHIHNEKTDTLLIFKEFKQKRKLMFETFIYCLQKKNIKKKKNIGLLLLKNFGYFLNLRNFDFEILSNKFYIILLNEYFSNFFFSLEKKKDYFIITKEVSFNFKKYLKNYSLNFYFILIIYQSVKNGLFVHLVFSIRFFLYILNKNPFIISKRSFVFFSFIEKLISYGFI
jgi:hypothetical protein